MAKKTQLVVSDVCALARSHGLIADESPETGAKNFVVVHNPNARYGARFHLARGKAKSSYIDAAAFKPEAAASLSGFVAFPEAKRPSGTVTHHLFLEGIELASAMESLAQAFASLAAMAAPVEEPVAVAAEQKE